MPEKLQGIKSRLVKDALSHGLSWDEVDWLISQAERVQELDAEVGRLKSIVQLDHDVHGEDQSTIESLQRRVSLLETQTKEVAAQMAKDIMRELVPGLSKTTSEVAKGAISDAFRGKS